MIYTLSPTEVRRESSSPRLRLRFASISITFRISSSCELLRIRPCGERIFALMAAGKQLVFTQLRVIVILDSLSHYSFAKLAASDMNGS